MLTFLILLLVLFYFNVIVITVMTIVIWLSLKCKISATWSAKTAYIFLIFLIATV